MNLGTNSLPLSERAPILFKPLLRRASHCTSGRDFFATTKVSPDMPGAVSSTLNQTEVEMRAQQSSDAESGSFPSERKLVLSWSELSYSIGGGGKIILDNLTGKVYGGEVLAIMGPSGGNFVSHHHCWYNHANVHHYFTATLRCRKRQDNAPGCRGGPRERGPQGSRRQGHHRSRPGDQDALRAAGRLARWHPFGEPSPLPRDVLQSFGGCSPPPLD